jgi:hypothetical protein
VVLKLDEFFNISVEEFKSLEVSLSLLNGLAVIWLAASFSDVATSNISIAYVKWLLKLADKP